MRSATMVKTHPRASHHNDNHPAIEPEVRRARLAAATEAAGRDSDISEFADSYGIKPFA